MSEDSGGHEAPTRRDYMKYGGAVVGGALLAGCAGQSDSESTPSETGETGETDESTATETSTPEDESYSVTMSPMGTVEFDSVPEEAAVYSGHNADILVALGQQDIINSLGFPENYYTGYYDELSGVSFDTSDLTKLYNGEGVDKEMFYELDSDVHHIDHTRARNWFDESDITEISENIGPWFANYWSRAHSAPDSLPDYQYYSIWEMLDKFAQVYKVPERGEAMRAVRDEMVENIHAELPAQGDRPQVGVVYYNYQEESFWVYRLNGQGFQNAHTRPLRANDGLEAYESGPASGWDSGAKIDMEALLEADPDVLVQFSDWTVPDEATEAFFAIDEHPVGQELTAVQNDRLYAGAQSFQGPIMNLFQIELTAKQFYPDQFGEAPEPGNTSELGEMFDVQRVANIINGDI